MSYDEKNAWAFLFIAIAGYTTYLVVILTKAAGGPLVDVDYAPAMLWTIGGAILVGILAGIAIGIASPKGADRRDERDKQISRFGDYVGQSFVIVGAVAALLLAIMEADYFWIANTIYLCFVLSGILGSIAKLASYRLGFRA